MVHFEDLTIYHETICVHEAGHAIVAHHLGLTVHKVVVDLPNDTFFCLIDVPATNSLKNRNIQAVLSYAGWLAEKRFGFGIGNTKHAATDKIAIRDALRDVVDPRSALRRARKQSDDLLLLHKDQVESLARVLLARERIDEAEVDLFFRYGHRALIGFKIEQRWYAAREAVRLHIEALRAWRKRKFPTAVEIKEGNENFALMLSEMESNPDFAAFVMERLHVITKTRCQSVDF